MLASVVVVNTAAPRRRPWGPGVLGHSRSLGASLC